jgi:hypothetical protein
VQETLARKSNHPSSAIVLVKKCLYVIHDFGMIFYEGTGAVEALLFATPMADEDSAFGVWIDLS